MDRRRFIAPGALRITGTAAAGVLAGHFLGYRIVFPGSPQRHAILIEAGHGYFPVAIRFGAMLAVIVAASTLASGYAHAKAGGYAIPERRVTTARLAFIQIGAFVLLELVERLVSGVPFHHLLLPVVVVGALTQLAIAAVGSSLISLLYRAGSAVARSGVLGCADAISPVWAPPRDRRASERRLDTPVPIRGPPSAPSIVLI
ncbi:MAG: hypothetical protein ACRDJ1_00990 [Actinomycetota bacterium]